MDLQELLPIGAAIASFAVAAVFAAWVSKQKPGTKEMRQLKSMLKSTDSSNGHTHTHKHSDEPLFTKIISFASKLPHEK